MTLSNQQIERYSRQIIVAKVGGVGQERLLASRILIAGEISDIEPVLAYMVGAGVGMIALRIPHDATDATNPPSASRCAPLITRMRNLNPDVTVEIAHDVPAGLQLVMIVAGSESSFADAHLLCAQPWQAPAVFVRLSADAKIAVLPERPPCPVCADASLLALRGGRASEAGFVAMVAAVEAFKLLVGYTPKPQSTIISFNGYAANGRSLVAGIGGSQRCACGSAASSAPVSGNRHG